MIFVHADIDVEPSSLTRIARRAMHPSFYEASGTTLRTSENLRCFR
ncbi:hypothetical protein BPSOL_0531 [Bifidobacterium pseudolongum]|nr:hypothetical protein BPSOL_0531 [Bifidobacterium pseudolongum]